MTEPPPPFVRIRPPAISQRWRVIASVASITATAVLLIAFGVIYMTRREIMPYHAEALGADWASLNTNTQTLLLALMRGVGGGFLAAGAALLYLTAIPLRRGERWSKWAILVVTLAVGIPALYATFLVSSRTTASPPIAAVLFGLAAAIVGVLLAPDNSSPGADTAA